MMDIEFTRHALARMQERGVSRDDVLNTLDNPIETVPVENKRQEARGWIDRAGKPYLLRVIYEKTQVISVITVIATSKFEKYGVKP